MLDILHNILLPLFTNTYNGGHVRLKCFIPDILSTLLVLAEISRFKQFERFLAEHIVESVPHVYTLSETKTLEIAKICLFEP